MDSDLQTMGADEGRKGHKMTPHVGAFAGSGAALQQQVTFDKIVSVRLASEGVNDATA